MIEAAADMVPQNNEIAKTKNADSAKKYAACTNPFISVLQK